MKYYVLGNPIESSNLSDESLRQVLLTSNMLWGYSSLDDAKIYAQQLNASVAPKIYPVFEIEVEEGIFQVMSSHNSAKIPKNAVTINPKLAKTFTIHIAYCDDKIFYLDEVELDSDSDSENDENELLIAHFEEKAKQEAALKAQQQKVLLEHIKQQRLEEEQRLKNNNQPEKPQPDPQRVKTINSHIAQAKKRVEDAQLAEKAKKATAAKLSVYLKYTALLSFSLAITLLVGFGGGFYIIADLLLKMGMTLAFTKINLIATALISGIFIPALLYTLYAIGVGIRILVENDSSTDQDKHHKVSDKLADDIHLIIDHDFQDNKKDQIFIDKLIRIEMAIEDIKFENNGSLAACEKQPEINRYQFLQYEYKALNEIKPLRGKIREDKENEIIVEATRKFRKPCSTNRAD